MIEQIIKNNCDGINTSMTLLDMFEIISNTPLFPSDPTALLKNNQLGILFGKPVYSLGDRVMVFAKCKYCHTEEYPKFSNHILVCSKCGAQIE